MVKTKTFESVMTFIEQFGESYILQRPCSYANSAISPSGVLFATEVELGGSLFSTERSSGGSQSEKNQLENKFRAALQTKFTIPVAVSVKADINNEKQDHSSSTVVNQTSQETKSWKQIGGSCLASAE